MCHNSCLKFGRQNLKSNDIRDKSVLEVGSLDVNGSLRSYVMEFSPKEYIGIDIQMGPGVDEVCDASNIIKRFGFHRFDLLLSTEMLEHARDWRRIVSNFKNVLKPNGLLLITTRSKGPAFHDYPFDFWRFEPEDMKYIFSDCKIEVLERDLELPGVFIKVRKPDPLVEYDTREYKLYSILKEKNVKDINAIDLILFKMHKLFGPLLVKILPSPLKNFIKRLLLGKSWS